MSGIVSAVIFVGAKALALAARNFLGTSKVLAIPGRWAMALASEGKGPKVDDSVKFAEVFSIDLPGNGLKN